MKICQASKGRIKFVVGEIKVFNVDAFGEYFFSQSIDLIGGQAKTF